MEHLLPTLAAIGRAEDAALGVRPPDVPERRDVDEVGVLRVDADAGDVAGVGEAAVRPGLAAIGGLVDTVAVRDVAANRRLAHPDVDHIRVALGDGNRAHGGRLEEAVGDVIPGGAAVGRLPDATGAGPEVEGHLVDRVARDGDDAPAPVWPAA